MILHHDFATCLVCYGFEMCGALVETYHAQIMGQIHGAGHGHFTSPKRASSHKIVGKFFGLPPTYVAYIRSW